ncbi:hypothetical protein CGLO_11238 [Colletotrichum gloeosporioides Cg-14]|uniref:Uncharacterized protein n=1 Tax=Colletotrichum gloeosporioides (strain Cg-14) TaxID=1237896 RepID=T0LMF4_COLGC|nr:hypothetical protein CGLO_11238 [Colletotrichum gloeosporioides Cg-14]
MEYDITDPINTFRRIDQQTKTN